MARESVSAVRRLRCGYRLLLQRGPGTPAKRRSHGGATVFAVREDRSAGRANEAPERPARAGRRHRSGARREEDSGEDFGRRIHREVIGDWAHRPDPRSLPPGAETAQETYARFLREDLAPRLRAQGLKGSGGHFHLDRGDLKGSFGFQKSTHDTKALVEFTINVDARHVPDHQAFWGDRIGLLLPEYEDTWWLVPAGADTTDLLADVLEAITDYALVAMQAAMELYQHPPDPGRRWRRTFPEPVRRSSGLTVHQLLQQPVPTVEEAFGVGL